MKSKSLIYVGVFLLTIGLLLKFLTEMGTIPVILMASGVTCKLVYILLIIIKGGYKPGFELLLLLCGFLLFLIGKKLHADPNINYAQFMIKSGIGLKILFVVLFLRKLRLGRK